MQYSNTFTLDDARQAVDLQKKLTAFSFKESQPSDVDGLINSLRGIKDSFSNMDTCFQYFQESATGPYEDSLKFIQRQISSVQEPLFDIPDEEDEEAASKRVFANILQVPDRKMTDEEFVAQQIKDNRISFNLDRRKGNQGSNPLGQLFSTKVRMPNVLRLPFYPADKAGDAKFKARTPIWGTVKALLPLMRQKFSLENHQTEQDDQTKPQARYRKMECKPILEKRIFGILNPHQVGHIPNVEINSTEDEVSFYRDVYAFKTMSPKSKKVEIDLDKEFFKHLGIDEHLKEALAEDEVDQTMSPGTIEAIEVFHEWLVASLYKKQKEVDYKACHSAKNEGNSKKYFIVPLKLVQPMPVDKFRMERLRETDYAPLEGNQKLGSVEYEIDHKLLAKVLRLKMNGYKNEQPNILDWMANNFQTREEAISALSKNILVKHDKFANCYQFHKLLDNLKDRNAVEVAEAIRGRPENLHCENGWELMFQAPTRFNCVQSFREGLAKKDSEEPGYKDKIEGLPIILMNPKKVITNDSRFKYNLYRCRKNLCRKTEVRKATKAKKDLTTNQGMPIFSAHDVYRHYFTVEQWERASQLPTVLTFFERMVTTHGMIAHFKIEVHPELALWATSCPGFEGSKKNYQTLETYGDTILKLAATFLAWDYLKKQGVSNERRINEIKDSYIRNLHLLKFGQALNMSQFLFSHDPDPSKWEPPFCTMATDMGFSQNTTGKNLADSVESLIGAVFLSTNLHKALQFISDVQLIPVVQAGLMKHFPNKRLDFGLPDELDCFGFDINDSVQEIFEKYYAQREVPVGEKKRMLAILDKKKPVAALGSRFAALDTITQQQLEMIEPDQIKKEVTNSLLPVEEILGYRFKNKALLLEAFSHTSFADTFKTGVNYETLEMVGDAILDYVVNSNMIKFTMFDRFNLRERLSQTFFMNEEFQPYDASKSKSMLTSNHFFAQLMCLLGLQEFILMSRKQDPSKERAVQDSSMSEQDKRKLEKAILCSGKRVTDDCNKYILYSFKKELVINNTSIEPYKPPKVLGDVFEALIGALFLDGGIETVLQVTKPILAPLVLFMAKHSKNVFNDPKDDISGFLNCLGYSVKYVRSQERRRLSEVLGTPLGSRDFEETFTRADIVYLNDQVIASGWGNNLAQAERNASVAALEWAKAQKQARRVIETQQFKQSFRGCFAQFLD